MRYSNPILNTAREEPAVSQRCTVKERTQYDSLMEQIKAATAELHDIADKFEAGLCKYAESKIGDTRKPEPLMPPVVSGLESLSIALTDLKDTSRRLRNLIEAIQI